MTATPLAALAMVVTARRVRLPSSSAAKIERCDAVPALLPSITATQPCPEAISVGAPLSTAAAAASGTIFCPYTANRDTFPLAVLLEYRNGPTSVTQHGACGGGPP